MFDEVDIQSVLLLIIFLLIIVVLYFLYSANVRERMIQQKLDDFELNCPACPKCPDIEGCPACPKCPDLKCPERTCPDTKVPSVDDIINGIFPGRDRGMTAGGQYFPIANYEYSCPQVGGATSLVPVGSNISEVVDVSYNDSSMDSSQPPASMDSSQPPASMDSSQPPASMESSQPPTNTQDDGL